LAVRRAFTAVAANARFATAFRFFAQRHAALAFSFYVVHIVAVKLIIMFIFYRIKMSCQIKKPGDSLAATSVFYLLFQYSQEYWNAIFLKINQRIN
jgi:hypothetical protein